MNSLTLVQRLACWQFRSQRATYYEDLAMLIDSSHMRLLDVFRQDGLRFGNAPRGELSRLWEERFIVYGADLASAWAGTASPKQARPPDGFTGTFPPSEVAPLSSRR